MSNHLHIDQAEPGHRGIETSVASAQKVKHSASTVKYLIVEALRGTLANATSDELAAHLEIPYKNVQPRCSDLKADGQIVDSGLRRPNADGNQVIVWRLA